jgi:hypothetical protein
MLRAIVCFGSGLGKSQAHIPNHYAPFLTSVLAPLLYERDSKVC